MSKAALFTSASSDWLTPAAVVEPLLAFAGPAGIALDPCSHPQSLVQTRARWVFPGPSMHCLTCDISGVTPSNHDGHQVCDAHDGLRMMWTCDGLVFCNPPYGRELLRWALKIEAEARAGVEIVSLIPARTDTAWWRELTRDAACWLAWSGRLSFDQPLIFWQAGELNRRAAGKRARPQPPEIRPGVVSGDPAPFPAALVYHGPRWARFCDVFGSMGQFYRRMP